MAQYEDDYDDGDLDDEFDDEDEDTPDTSTDEGLIDAITDLLARKCHLDLPPDTNPTKFLRDLYGALHGHPGVELLGGTEQMSARAANLRAERLSHRRQRRAAQSRLSAGRPEARREAVLSEVMANVKGAL